MDRFAQFFRTPLFAESALERELQAVDSEHSNNKNEDTWRIYQVPLNANARKDPFREAEGAFPLRSPGTSNIRSTSES